MNTSRYGSQSSPWVTPKVALQMDYIQGFKQHHPREFSQIPTARYAQPLATQSVDPASEMHESPLSAHTHGADSKLSAHAEDE
jgi:hypothetical protein